MLLLNACCWEDSLFSRVSCTSEEGRSSSKAQLTYVMFVHTTFHPYLNKMPNILDQGLFTGVCPLQWSDHFLGKNMPWLSLLPQKLRNCCGCCLKRGWADMCMVGSSGFFSSSLAGHSKQISQYLWTTSFVSTCVGLLVKASTGYHTEQKQTLITEIQQYVNKLWS